MINKIIQTTFCTVIAFALQACTTAQTPTSYYDFGTPSKMAQPIGCELPALNLSDMSTTPALDSNLMLYRLLYSNDQQTEAYANHRWSMPPAQLLMLQIKSQLADSNVRLIDDGVANPNGLQLRLDLTDFSQYFTDANHSYVQLKLRATTLRGDVFFAQSTLTQQVTTDSSDAPGGAKAMRVAADAFVADLTGWLCKLTHQ